VKKHENCVENSVWKRLWTCRKTDCVINGIIKYVYDQGLNFITEHAFNLLIFGPLLLQYYH
jgi:hypothetical protein